MLDSVAIPQNEAAAQRGAPQMQVENGTLPSGAVGLGASSEFVIRRNATFVCGGGIVWLRVGNGMTRRPRDGVVVVIRNGGRGGDGFVGC